MHQGSEDKFFRLPQGRNRLTDTVKMIAYGAESAMAGILKSQTVVWLQPVDYYRICMSRKQMFCRNRKKIFCMFGFTVLQGRLRSDYRGVSEKTVIRFSNSFNLNETI